MLRAIRNGWYLQVDQILPRLAAAPKRNSVQISCPDPVSAAAEHGLVDVERSFALGVLYDFVEDKPQSIRFRVWKRFGSSKTACTRKTNVSSKDIFVSFFFLPHGSFFTVDFLLGNVEG